VEHRTNIAMAEYAHSKYITKPIGEEYKNEGFQIFLPSINSRINISSFDQIKADKIVLHIAVDKLSSVANPEGVEKSASKFQLFCYCIEYCLIPHEACAKLQHHRRHSMDSTTILTTSEMFFHACQLACEVFVPAQDGIKCIANFALEINPSIEDDKFVVLLRQHDVNDRKMECKVHKYIPGQIPDLDASVMLNKSEIDRGEEIVLNISFHATTQQVSTAADDVHIQLPEKRRRMSLPRVDIFSPKPSRSSKFSWKNYSSRLLSNQQMEFQTGAIVEDLLQTVPGQEIDVLQDTFGCMHETGLKLDISDKVVDCSACEEGGFRGDSDEEYPLPGIFSPSSRTPANTPTHSSQPAISIYQPISFEAFRYRNS
jgi:hypothetical protein